MFQETSRYFLNELRHLTFQNRIAILVKGPLFLKRHCQLLQGRIMSFTLCLLKFPGLEIYSVIFPQTFLPVLA